jgi:hypothetical protein
VQRSVSRPNVSRDAQASGLKRATTCHVCLSSDRTARAEPLLIYGLLDVWQARIDSPKASFWNWSLRQSFEHSHCEYQIGVTLGDDALLAAACSQSILRTASLPLPEI